MGRILKIAKEEAGSQVVETWFKAVCLEEINLAKHEVTLQMPNNFVSNWIQEHYHTLLITHLKRLLNISSLTVIFSGPNTAPPEKNEPEQELSTSTAVAAPSTFRPATITKMTGTSMVAPPQAPKSERHTLNEAYQFDSFVVGPSNSLAHGAAYAVSQSLGTVYNPLLIYGGTGLGKNSPTACYWQ